MHPVSVPASTVPNTNMIPIFEPVVLFVEFFVFAWSLFANLFFIIFLSASLSVFTFIASGEILMTRFFARSLGLVVDYYHVASGERDVCNGKRCCCPNSIELRAT